MRLQGPFPAHLPLLSFEDWDPSRHTPSVRLCKGGKYTRDQCEAWPYTDPWETGPLPKSQNSPRPLPRFLSVVTFHSDMGQSVALHLVGTRTAPPSSHPSSFSDTWPAAPSTLQDHEDSHSSCSQARSVLGAEESVFQLVPDSTSLGTSPSHLQQMVRATSRKRKSMASRPSMAPKPGLP